jgi:3-oxoacyl-[acyl-carrier protein] reductase
MEIRLDGRSALVTGGSRGLGLAVARRFVTAGAEVAIAARRKEPLEEARAALAAEGPGRVVTIAADVGDAQGARTTAEAALGAFGKVDILVNNAGSSSRGDLDSLDDEVWQADIDLKLLAAVRLGRLLVPGMKDRRWGRVLNVVSVNGKAPPARGAPTAVTRAAGIALTKVMAGELAPYNVLVNALCIGKIRTDQWTGFHQREAPELDFGVFLRRSAADIPLGRLGEAEELASVACFLASEHASYLTGTAINVDGGRSPVT